MSMDEALATYPIRVQFPLHWGEMDAFQHVNNAVYFRYFESARIAYFRATGILGGPGIGVGPILASTSCKFIVPLTYPDDVVACARVTDVGEDRFKMQYAVFSSTHQRIAAVGEGVVVSYDYEGGQKVSVPAAWTRAIQDLEARGFQE